MIKKSRQLLGLSNYITTIDFIDSSDNAEYTFQVYDFPDRFYLGKNSFKILANTEFLANNAPILIDIEDKAGNSIYHEVTTIINKDRSRTIVVYIYDDTPIGNSTVYLASKLKKNPLNGTVLESGDVDSINVLWKKEVLVSTSKVATEPIIFSNPPTIFFQEKLVQKRIFSGTGSRFTSVVNSGSSKVALSSKFRNYELSNSRELKDIDLSSKQLDVVPSFPGSNVRGRVESPIRIPTYQKGSILKTTLFPLTSSMEGGTFIVRNIHVTGSAPAGLVSSLPTLDYSASIIKVINSTTAELYPPFQYDATYSDNGVLRTVSFNSFRDERNFTASWLNPQTAIPSVTQSFLELDLYNLQPVIGNVKSVAIRYKEVGGFGTFFDLGKYTISRQNLFLDTSLISFADKGLSEKRMGFPEPSDNVNLYWTSSGMGVTSIYLSQSDRSIQNSIFISHSGITDANSYVAIKSREKFIVPLVENTNYEMSLFACPTTTGSYSIPQLDIYISGSKVLTGNRANLRNKLDSIQTTEFGTYLGTIRAKSGSIQEFREEFEVQESNGMVASFVIRDGNWEIGQVSIEAITEEGYSPNQAKLFIPLPVLPAGQELLFELEYLNEKDEPSELTQRFSGLYFQGSDPDNIQDIQDILGPDADYRNSRLILGNPGELQLSFTSSAGESSAIFFITQSTFTSTGVGSTDVFFPIFEDIDNNIYSGATHAVGLNFQIETVVFGKTGSFSALKDTNLWSSTVQGRALVSDFDNSEGPLLYRTIIFSGSSEGALGTYGSGPVAKTNLDSWYSISTTFILNNQLGVRHVLAPTSAFAWDFYLTSTCKVNKFSYRI